jgi:hypothetical protein
MSNEITRADSYLLGMDKVTLRSYTLCDEICQPATAERLAMLRVNVDMHVLEFGCAIGDTACYLTKGAGRRQARSGRGDRCRRR